MSSPADELQRVFRTLSDPTRVRILALLQQEELMVQELMEVLGMAQSRVSRHLAILREAGLVEDRRDGTRAFYRFSTPNGPWSETWAVVERSLTSDTTAQRDSAALAGVIDARAADSPSFFDAVGPEWDALRKVFDDDLLRARAICRLVPTGLRVADIGTGTGVLALELARAGLDVVGIDASARMLESAREKAEQLDQSVVSAPEWRIGDAHALPLANDELDVAFAHMVLQYLASPADAIAEMARCVKPGGRIVVVDFLRHDQDWMREELGVRWSGFDEAELSSWIEAAGLAAPHFERHAASGRGRNLPATFIAVAEQTSAA